MASIRSVGEQQARREIRVIARHLAHISKDADPVKLAELHGTLGRAIAETATSKLNGEPS
ncbi:hypothetical protein [Glutamicibacter ardleyensis]|uniref:hypothetical protein n=1 Tax=Glutamicibacter ardleyensis TaxID=225894 RepID=UPI003FD61E19